MARMNKNTKSLIGGIGYAVLGEPLLDAGASKLGLNQADDFIKGIMGWVISQNSKGIVKSVGDSAVNISAYKVGGQRFGNLLGSFGNQSTNNNPQTSGGATFE